LARELIILPRFKHDYRSARKHPEFDAETLEYVFDVMVSGGKLPEALREHTLGKRNVNWVGFTECHLGADLLLIYRVRRESVTLHRIGTHRHLFAAKRDAKRRSSTRQRRKLPK
jgi:addiction module RelE/StbE family toxin